MVMELAAGDVDVAARDLAIESDSGTAPLVIGAEELRAAGVDARNLAGVEGGVIALRAPGHTPGSLGVLVDDRFLLSCDTHAEFTANVDELLADVLAGARGAPAEHGRIREVNLGVERAEAEALDELEIGKNQCAA